MKKRLRRAARPEPKLNEDPINRTNQRVFWALSLLLLAIAIGWLSTFFKMASDRRLEQAESALTLGQFAHAQQLADEVLADDPTSPKALLIASYAAVGQDRIDTAIEYLECVPNDSGEIAVIARNTLGNFAIKRGYASRAESHFRTSLQLDPANAEASKHLIRLLVQENRIWEAQQLILPLLKRGRVSSNYLIVASSPEIWLADVSDFAERCLAAVPDDPLPLLNEAGEAWRNNNSNRAEEILRKIVAAHPDNTEAQSQLGRIIAELPEPIAFVKWHRTLPESADAHPAIWFDRGLWSQRQGQLESAARCYWEAISRQPNHTAANYQLSQVLIALEQVEQASVFAERGRLLARLYLTINMVKSEWKSREVERLVEMLETLGRPWEAAGWCELELRKDANARWASTALPRLRGKFAEYATFTLDSHNPARQIDLSEYRLPHWNLEKNQIEHSGPHRDLASTIKFVDSAAATGIDFRYQNGAIDDGFESLFEMDGGGVAVLDYDRDGWPDLYFTQGGVLPPGSPSSDTGDRLFRNLGNDRFADVTTEAGLGDKGYSQGVTVGDFDNDGFPDLYVANIGRNRLYRNNGDATFTDITTIAGVGGSEWTSSCALADFNGDTLPDLYAVNYLGGDDLYSRRCPKKPGPRCAPVDFPAEQDRLYLNLGDGRFEDATQRCGIVATDGRGLGVVVADFDGSRRLSLFVANDMSANFLFANQSVRRGAALSFSETGILSGAAYNTQGIAQASMGIAAGDANEDGLLDLFVTNFYREANNCYIQHSDGLFLDESRTSNLLDAGFEMLGWGTQFLDGDLDGRLDLVVANGHVHDPLDSEIPFRMRPHFYRNLGRGRFSQLPSNKIGSYFGGSYLGRAVVRLDWNRDGQEDVCITHLDAPVALLTNRTNTDGHFLAIRLVGIASDRDAIGATVRLTAGDIVQTRQMTAGDGFQASNQRQIVFGVGAAEVVDLLEVDWPSGLTQHFREIPTDRQILLIEDRSDYFPQLP